MDHKAHALCGACVRRLAHLPWRDQGPRGHRHARDQWCHHARCLFALGARYITVVDAASFLYQFCVRRTHQNRFTVTSHRGLEILTVAPIGLQPVKKVKGTPLGRFLAEKNNEIMMPDSAFEGIMEKRAREVAEKARKKKKPERPPYVEESDPEESSAPSERAATEEIPNEPDEGPVELQEEADNTRNKVHLKELSARKGKRPTRKTLPNSPAHAQRYMDRVLRPYRNFSRLLLKQR